MGARSITRIVTTEGVAAFYLPDGSPEYQVPRIAQFLLLLDLGGEPVTIDAWQQFAATTSRDGRAVAAEQVADPDDLPSEIDHLYVINAAEWSFAHYRADRSPWALGRWAVQAEADTLAEVLALAVRYAELLVRRAHQFAWVDNGTRVAAEQWATTARRMVLVHRATEGAYVAPPAEQLPARSDDQDPAEHARTVAAFCAEQAEYMSCVAEGAQAERLNNFADLARREARGWTRTGHRHWLATL